MTDDTRRFCESIDQKYRAEPDKAGQWLGTFFHYGDDAVKMLTDMGYEICLYRSPFPELGTKDEYQILMSVRRCNKLSPKPVDTTLSGV